MSVINTSISDISKKAIELKSNCTFSITHI
jgi:hypothetical protein